MPTLLNLINDLESKGVKVTTISSYYHLDGKLKTGIIDMTKQYTGYDINIHINSEETTADIDCNDD